MVKEVFRRLATVYSARGGICDGKFLIIRVRRSTPDCSAWSLVKSIRFGHRRRMISLL